MDEFDDATQPVQPPVAGEPVAGVHDVVAGLRAAVEAVGLVAAGRTSALSGEQLRTAVADGYALLASAQAAVLHLVRALDERPEAVAGASAGRVAQTFLTDKVRLSRGQAAADVAAAWAVDPDGSGFTLGADPIAKAATVDLREAPGTVAGTVAGARVAPLPMLGQTLANGYVHRAHIDVAVRSLRRIPSDALTTRVSDQNGEIAVGAVDTFVTKASLERSPQTLDRLAAHLLESLGVNPPDKPLRDQHERRHVTLSTDRAGMVHLHAQFDPASGLLVKAALEAFITRSTPTPDDTDAAERPLFNDLRTLGQRRADAMVAWAHAVLHTTGCTCGGASVLRPTAKVVLVATPAQLEAAVRAHPLAVDADGAVLGPPADAPPTAPDPAAGCAVDEWGDPLTPGVLSRLLCGAELQAVTLTETGKVLDLGRTTRLATPRQRAALIARDRGCVMPDCTAPLSQCQAHHAVWWRNGGTTDIDNLALVCSRHHTAIHTGTWVLQMRDGIPYVIPPRWIDPTGTPRRNTLRDAEHHARRLGTQLRIEGVA